MAKKINMINKIKEFANGINYEVLDYEYIDSKTHMQFKCKNCGHVLKRNYSNFTRQHNCPCCGDGKLMWKIDMVKDFIENNNCELLNTKWDKGVNSWITLKCKDCGHEFNRVFFNFKENPTCPKCRENSRQLSYEDAKYFIEIESNSGCKFICTKEEYKQKRLEQPQMVLCDFNFLCSCGKIFYRALAEFKGRRLFKCYDCTGASKPITYDDLKQELNEYNIEILTTEYINNKQKLHIRCEFGHESHRNIINIRKSNYTCPYCNKKGYNRNTEILKNEIKEETNEEYELLSEYKTMNDYVVIRHVECGYKWSITPHNFLDARNRCPKCQCSKGEKRIDEYLIKNNIFKIPQKEFDGLLGLGGGNLSYDFYLPQYNMLIEYQGKQHEKYIKGLQKSKKNFEKQLEHDKRKREYAKTNNINLLEIWYYDFDNIEEILKAKLNNIDNIKYIFDECTSF